MKSSKACEVTFSQAPSETVRNCCTILGTLPNLPDFVSLASSLRKVREREGTTSRKLIGHSGPVYSLSFDPLSGSAAPPQYLLSSSADATVRLWSMETMSNIVAYRGHQNPVWDVQWSPMGIYFATGSRDKTARLWSTDKVSALRVYAGHLSDVDVNNHCPISFRS